LTEQQTFPVDYSPYPNIDLVTVPLSVGAGEIAARHRFYITISLESALQELPYKR